MTASDDLKAYRELLVEKRRRIVDEAIGRGPAGTSADDNAYRGIWDPTKTAPQFCEVQDQIEAVGRALEDETSLQAPAPTS